MPHGDGRIGRCPEDVDAVAFTTRAVDGIQALHATAAALREQVWSQQAKPCMINQNPPQESRLYNKHPCHTVMPLQGKSNQFVCNVLVAPKQEPTLNVQVIATARVPILMASALSHPGRRLTLSCSCLSAGLIFANGL